MNSPGSVTTATLPSNTVSMEKKKQVVVIGGGVIGLNCAWYLQKEGMEVTVIERGDICNGCSFGNMGYFSPSHFIPLASPGIIAEGLRYMLKSTSPFYIKPRLSRSLIEWAWHFWKSSNASTVMKNAPHLNAILQYSRGLLNDIRDELGNAFSMEEKGCLMMCREQKALDHEFHLADEAEKMGLQVERLGREQVQQLEPGVELNVRGAVLFKDDCHVNPGEFMYALKRSLQDKGVSFALNTEVTGFEKKGDSISTIRTSKGEFTADEIVVATGSWLPAVAKMMGVKILLQAGKGYSYTYERVENNIRYPAILLEGRCAMTPWQHRLRIGGTMEISGINETILPLRMKGIYSSVRDFYPGLQIDPPPESQIWYGFRPVSPDGVPYIGRPAELRNVIFAGGHAMVGVSLAPATGKLVTDIIQRKKTGIGVEAFRLNRF